MIESIATPTHWLVFVVGVLLLLALDLGVFHRRARSESFGAALGWSVFWIGLSLAFNFWIYLRFGADPGLEFLTGYLIEKALSVDNIFVFVIIFRYFAVPDEYQHRVLFWGVVGAIVLRAIFIALGTALLARFHWILLVFGAFLIFTGFRILRHDEVEVHPESNPVVRFFRRLVPITSEFRGQRFFTRVEGHRFATPLMVVLVMIEATDVVFAVDSIPAIFGVTTDPFLVFTSNIMAVLGLRALYFVLAGVMHRFRYLNYGLGLVLMFIGVKMLTSDLFHVPTTVSLGVVFLLLAGSILISWLRPPPPAGAAAGEGPGSGPREA